ncbi:MAG: hypothetical protein ACQEQ4_06525 [Fibrobacterota bacterium]
MNTLTAVILLCLCIILLWPHRIILHSAGRTTTFSLRFFGIPFVWDSAGHAKKRMPKIPRFFRRRKKSPPADEPPPPPIHPEVCAEERHKQSDSEASESFWQNPVSDGGGHTESAPQRESFTESRHTPRDSESSIVSKIWSFLKSCAHLPALFIHYRDRLYALYGDMGREVKKCAAYGAKTTRRFFRIIRPRKLKCSFWGGFTDPYVTAQTAVYVQTAFEYMNFVPGVYLVYYPSYGEREKLSWEGDLFFRFSLIQFIWFGILCCVTFPYTAVYRMFRYGRKLQREGVI